MSNIRKFENATVEQEISIIQHELFSFSAFCTELHCVADCRVEGCKRQTFCSELDILVRE